MVEERQVPPSEVRQGEEGKEEEGMEKRKVPPPSEVAHRASGLVAGAEEWLVLGWLGRRGATREERCR